MLLTTVRRNSVSAIRTTGNGLHRSWIEFLPDMVGRVDESLSMNETFTGVDCGRYLVS